MSYLEIRTKKSRQPLGLPEVFPFENPIAYKLRIISTFPSEMGVTLIEPPIWEKWCSSKPEKYSPSFSRYKRFHVSCIFIETKNTTLTCRRLVKEPFLDLPSLKLTARTWKWVFPKGKSSSNHPFSGVYAIFRECKTCQPLVSEACCAIGHSLETWHSRTRLLASSMRSTALHSQESGRDEIFRRDTRIENYHFAPENDSLQ